MKEDKMEMSKLDIHIPKYYKGFDMDVLIQNLYDGKPLTKEEESVVADAIDVFHKKHFEENRKKAAEWKKAHPGEYTKNVSPRKFVKGKKYAI